MSNLSERANLLAAQQQAQNKDIRSWANITKAELVRNIHTMNVKQNYDLLERMVDTRPKYKQAYGDIFRIVFPNTIGGIMTHHGVGRGGSRNRTAKNWYGSTMDAKIEILADVLMEHKAAQAVTDVETAIKILG